MAAGRFPVAVVVEAHQSPVIVPAQLPGAARAPVAVRAAYSTTAVEVALLVSPPIS